jgi:hypothetical protein
MFGDSSWHVFQRTYKTRFVDMENDVERAILKPLITGEQHNEVYQKTVEVVVDNNYRKSLLTKRGIVSFIKMFHSFISQFGLISVCTMVLSVSAYQCAKQSNEDSLQHDDTGNNTGNQ